MGRIKRPYGTPRVFSGSSTPTLSDVISGKVRIKNRNPLEVYHKLDKDYSKELDRYLEILEHFKKHTNINFTFNNTYAGIRRGLRQLEDAIYYPSRADRNIFVSDRFEKILVLHHIRNYVTAPGMTFTFNILELIEKKAPYLFQASMIFFSAVSTCVDFIGPRDPEYHFQGIKEMVDFSSNDDSIVIKEYKDLIKFYRTHVIKWFKRVKSYKPIPPEEFEQKFKNIRCMSLFENAYLKWMLEYYEHYYESKHIDYYWAPVDRDNGLDREVWMGDIIAIWWDWDNIQENIMEGIDQMCNETGEPTPAGICVIGEDNYDKFTWNYGSLQFISGGHIGQVVTENLKSFLNGSEFNTLQGYWNGLDIFQWTRKFIPGISPDKEPDSSSRFTL